MTDMSNKPNVLSMDDGLLMSMLLIDETQCVGGHHE